jgi:hypothetical protein
MARLSKDYPLPANVLLDLVRTALLHLNIQMDTQASAGFQVSGTTATSLFSWGETVRVMVDPLPQGSRLVAESQPTLFTNIFAAPRAESNVVALVHEVDRLVEGIERQSTKSSFQ